MQHSNYTTGCPKKFGIRYATFFFCKYVLSVSKLVFESFFVNCSKAMPTFMQLIFYQSKTPKPCQYFALLSQHGLSFKARRLKLYMSNNRTLGCVRLHAKFQPRRLKLCMQPHTTKGPVIRQIDFQPPSFKTEAVLR